MEEPGDKENRYLWVILIVTNDNLQETKMQDDHHHPGYNLKEESFQGVWCIQLGHQREDDPYERGPLYLRVWRRRGFHKQVHRNECRKAKQLGVQEETGHRATETSNKKEKEDRLQILLL